MATVPPSPRSQPRSFGSVSTLSAFLPSSALHLRSGQRTSSGQILLAELRQPRPLRLDALRALPMVSTNATLDSPATRTPLGNANRESCPASARESVRNSSRRCSACSMWPSLVTWWRMFCASARLVVLIPSSGSPTFPGLSHMCYRCLRIRTSLARTTCSIFSSCSGTLRRLAVMRLRCGGIAA